MPVNRQSISDAFGREQVSGPGEVLLTAKASDPDGDALRVESVSAPSHGMAQIVDDGVSYTPAEDYYGEDRFAYVATDGNGGTASANVVVTVRPVADAPAVAAAIPDQTLEEGGRDGGDGQTGRGVEVAGGARFAFGRVRLEAQGRPAGVRVYPLSALKSLLNASRRMP